MENEILHCPFCGNTNVEIEQHQTGQMETISFVAVVKCSKCGMFGPVAATRVSVYDSKLDAREYTKQKAIELWNNRV